MITPSFVKAIIGCCLLSISSGPLGVFLVLRRMTLIGDALSHGLLPGIALGFLLFGHSVAAMTFFGGLSGLLLAYLATTASWTSRLSEDLTFSGFYLISMALGILALYNHQEDLFHILSGSLTSVTAESLGMMGLVSFGTCLFFRIYYSDLVIICFDPIYFRCMGKNEKNLRIFFIGVLAMNLMVSFQLFGTLLSLGLIVLPALIARLLIQELKRMCIAASLIGAMGSFIGLCIVPDLNRAAPAIIVVLGLGYIAALIYHRFKV